MTFVLSNPNKSFFILTKFDEQFDIAAENLLQDAWNVQCKYFVRNDLTRNVQGQLIQLNKDEKLNISLSGKGNIKTLDAKVSFLSSVLQLNKEAVQKRNIVRDGEKEMPVISCFVVKQSISDDESGVGWYVELEEI